jgi:sugar/nucleoside kinase (ribokinase family)
MDLRSLTFLEGQTAYKNKNPFSYLSRRDVALPSELIGYSSHWPLKSSRRERGEISIREAEIPLAYKSASGAHICPLDYLSHNLLPAMLRGKGFATLTLDPCSSYMTPDFFGDFPALLPGLTAIFPSEEDLRSLYKGKSVDLWEIATDLGHYGCELVVIKRGARGQYLYESATERKWDIPAYPARVVNPVGVGDAFCGGFLAAYRRSFDPLEAVFHGSVSASLTIEGQGAFFGLEALPGLAEARLEVLRGTARAV